VSGEGGRDFLFYLKICISHTPWPGKPNEGNDLLISEVCTNM